MGASLKGPQASSLSKATTTACANAFAARLVQKRSFWTAPHLTAVYVWKQDPAVAFVSWLCFSFACQAWAKIVLAWLGRVSGVSP